MLSQVTHTGGDHHKRLCQDREKSKRERESYVENKIINLVKCYCMNVNPTRNPSLIPLKGFIKGLLSRFFFIFFYFFIEKLTTATKLGFAFSHRDHGDV